jgi:aryl-alcohol dehydrogenase-like predicted oxidoreductase
LIENASRLALGTAQFGLKYGIANRSGQVAVSEVARIISRAGEVGLDTLDTAIAYGDAENRLGTVNLAEWKVVTKLPPIPAFASVASWVRTQVSESIARLKVPSLYGLMLHQPRALLSTQGTVLFDVLEELRRAGFVEKIGISAYQPEEIFAVLDRFDIGIVQAPFNVFDRRVQESGCLAVLARQGIEFHARSVFLQGLLLMDTYDRPSQFARWAGLWAQWHSWLSETNTKPLNATLGFVASDARVGRMVVGVDNLVQLNQVIQAVNSPVTINFPTELASDDPALINPSKWSEH